jgi:hypothetical protein
VDTLAVAGPADLTDDDGLGGVGGEVPPGVTIASPTIALVGVAVGTVPDALPAGGLGGAPCWRPSESGSVGHEEDLLAITERDWIRQSTHHHAAPNADPERSMWR